MSENLRKELGIDDWLKLVKEDKNLDSAYISFAQYMDTLEKENQHLKEQLKQKDKVIDEIGNIMDTANCRYMINEKVYVNSFCLSDFYKILNKYKGGQ